jgi:hypothetical protein
MRRVATEEKHDCPIDLHYPARGVPTAVRYGI